MRFVCVHINYLQSNWKAVCDRHTFFGLYNRDYLLNKYRHRINAFIEYLMAFCEQYIYQQQNAICIAHILGKLMHKTYLYNVSQWRRIL